MNDYLLISTPDYLGLKKGNEKPFYIDFVNGKMGYRHRHAAFKKELLAKAIHLKPASHPVIVDATAGWGRDSFILAARGYHVIMLERSPMVYALLNDALTRAQAHQATAAIAAKLQLINADALDWLPAHPKPDVIYLDPMFPMRKKSALVKKEMILLQDLLGAEDDTALLELALTCASKRVVVKRPRLASFLNGRKSDFSITGKNSRFDVYLS